MLRSLATGVLAIFLCGATARSTAATDDPPPFDSPPRSADRDLPTSRSDVADLIGALGSDEFTERRRAEQQLIELGAAVYDELREAEDNDDLEIANRASYILHQIEIDWVRPDDSDQVAPLMARYPELGESDRLQIIRRLGRLAGETGFAPLCRIVRYESSPRLARHAANSAITAIFSSSKPARLVAEICDKECGTSQRSPVRWVRTYADELSLPSGSVARWSQAIRKEIELLESGSGATDVIVVLHLIEHQLQLCNRLHLVDEPAAALELMVGLSDARERNRMLLSLYLSARTMSGRISPSYEAAVLYLNPRSVGQEIRVETELLEPQLIRAALDWILESEAWQVQSLFQPRHQDVINQRRLLLYLTAAAHARKGQSDAAEATAQRAYSLTVSSDNGDERDDAQEADQRVGALLGVPDRLESADAIADLGFVDWAMREYRYILDLDAPPDYATLNAASDLAMWLHDREQHRAASEAIKRFCDAMDADTIAKRKLIAALNQRGASGQAYLKQLYARRHYYLACHHQQRKEFDQQRKELLAAAQRFAGDNSAYDPDVLIAMFRSPGADERFRTRTLALLRIAKQGFDKSINDDPQSPHVYNQWAWLVANTEGDFDLAVEYSHKSLELSPDEPSYLDTLGRCYYAAGDLESAVKYQRRAVQLQPHMLVMQRQLAQFESELAEQSADDQSTTPAPSVDGEPSSS